MKYNNICIIGISDGEEKEQRIENLFEKKMTEEFPNVVKRKGHTNLGSTEGPN